MVRGSEKKYGVVEGRESVGSGRRESDERWSRGSEGKYGVGM